MDIPLDPLLTPQQNAAKYYKDYKKAQKAEEMLSIQLEKNRRELDYLDSVLQMFSELRDAARLILERKRW